MQPHGRDLDSGGEVLDGTGGPARRADVAISGGRIEAIGPKLRNTDGAVELDASGHYVAPGFIDIHTHYDAQVFWDRLRLTVVLPRRHHRRGRQLRLLPGTNPARTPRRRHRHPRKRRGHEPGQPDGWYRVGLRVVPRLPRIDRSARPGAQLRGIHRTHSAASLRDGRRLRARGDAR